MSTAEPRAGRSATSARKKKPARPRRKRVPGKLNHHVFERYDGKYEVGYRDSTGTQRWPGPFDTIKQARAERDTLLGRKGKGEHVEPNAKIKFGPVADKFLSDYVSDLAKSTRASAKSYIKNHLLPRWKNRQLDSITPDDAAQLVRDLRRLGLAEWTIAGIVGLASRIFKFARRRCKWRGENPFDVLERGERAKVSQAPERRVYTDDELAQVLAATTDRWRTLFQAADFTAGRESELLGWWWEDLDLDNLDTAAADFKFQVDRDGERVRLKTEESKSRVPLSRAAVILLRKHKAASKHTRPKDYVFCTDDGGPLHQRNVLRALYRAQEAARKPDGTPTFPELFEHDGDELIVDAKGAYVLNGTPRRELNLPHFHSLRHGAAMNCEDAEEARDLLRHKNTNVTNAVYRPHFSEKRREALRAKLNARQQAERRDVHDEEQGPQVLAWHAEDQAA